MTVEYIVMSIGIGVSVGALVYLIIKLFKEKENKE
jgi:hypothetical protein